MSTMISKFWSKNLPSILIAVVAIFAFSQLVTSIHAAKYGDGPHEHGGQVCVLSLAAPDGDNFIPSAAFVLIVVFSFWRASNGFAQTERAHILVRAASPRGPPNR